MDGFKRPVRHPADTPGVPQRTDTASQLLRPSGVMPVSTPPSLATHEAELPPRLPATPPEEPPVDLQPLEISEKTSERVLKKKRSGAAKFGIFLGIVVALLLLVAGGVYAWYFSMTMAPDPENDRIVGFEVKPNTSLSTIGDQLKERGLIKNAFVFSVYARLNGHQNAIQTGTCNLSPAETIREVMEKLTAGCHDFSSVTFYPGATIEKPTFKPEGSTISLDLYVKNMLRKAGYTDTEIEQALSATYKGPLFDGKPAGTTLEGYVFGETYHVATDASAQDVLQVAFDHMYEVVQRNGLVAKYKTQGLDLYQGITMASIVQRELNCEDKPTKERKDRCHAYQKTIASVFYNRLKINMPLGSDSTFIYAADMLGVPATSRIDSPYNTYRVTGLPPGPIGSPGELALNAAAEPDKTDYLFFVAGDDGLIYFSRTQAEHEANTAKYCKILCAY